MVRTIRAPNPSALTMDGTRTYLVGRSRVVVIDPGSDSDRHLDEIIAQVSDARVEAILITHRHPDHSAGARELACHFRAPILTGIANDGFGEELADGTRIETDAGELIALFTPGHTPDHFSFHLRAEAAVFVGDLMLGGMETALVAYPEGDLRAYLESLEGIRRLRPAILYPGHGPPFTDPEAAIEGYIAHRRARGEQVLTALRGRTSSVEELVALIYGPELESGLVRAAGAAMRAYLEYLRGEGAVERIDDLWRVREEG